MIDYPWRTDRTPYKVLISEILLIRTKAPQVEPVYSTFVKKYPEISEFIGIKKEEITPIIKSLGLSFRTDILFEIAKTLKSKFNGEIPDTLKELKSLKGIGDYGANAVLCFGFGQKRPLLDANFIRIYERVFNVKPKTKTAKSDKFLWEFSKNLLPNTNVINYNYGILDIGGSICQSRKKLCEICPLSFICCYFIINLKAQV